MRGVSLLIVIGVLILALVLTKKFYSYFKTPKVGCLALITGGVKAGKSTFAVFLALKQYKRALRSWRLRAFFQRLTFRQVDEKPLLYSNVPLSVPYVQLTTDMLLRKVRFRYHSVVYINEASLVADSQLVHYPDINERLSLFFKLFGHETGGYLVMDTHCISDNHYAVKRCTSEYFYVHHLIKWVPFFLVAYVREDRYSDDGTLVSINDQDVEDTLKRVIIPRRTWKKFDSRCFSSLTDSLPVGSDVIELDKDDSLKVDKVVSFRKFISIPKEFQENTSGGLNKNA